MGPHKMKTSHYFQSLIPSETWDFLYMSEDPFPYFELYPTETWVQSHFLHLNGP